jgi:hypothetical protein
MSKERADSSPTLQDASPPRPDYGCRLSVASTPAAYLPITGAMRISRSLSDDHFSQCLMSCSHAFVQMTFISLQFPVDVALSLAPSTVTACSKTAGFSMHSLLAVF